ncbi:hypothetical protein VP01_1453g1 [Puccinia sorghi]|uniref:Uncharacterized protein n=1 Tax=Puccinia sorghi TaxID=27349 RepID=A0A0L6VK57_9BASI|nr:hypothetical protein VP01_1453g1 [Puccinia sorghi]
MICLPVKEKRPTTEKEKTMVQQQQPSLRSTSTRTRTRQQQQQTQPTQHAALSAHQRTPDKKPSKHQLSRIQHQDLKPFSSQLAWPGPGTPTILLDQVLLPLSPTEDPLILKVSPRHHHHHHPNHYYHSNPPPSPSPAPPSFSSHLDINPPNILLKQPAITRASTSYATTNFFPVNHLTHSRAHSPTDPPIVNSNSPSNNTPHNESEANPIIISTALRPITTKTSSAHQSIQSSRSPSPIMYTSLATNLEPQPNSQIEYSSYRRTHLVDAQELDSPEPDSSHSTIMPGNHSRLTSTKEVDLISFSSPPLAPSQKNTFTGPNTSALQKSKSNHRTSLAPSSRRQPINYHSASPSYRHQSVTQSQPISLNSPRRLALRSMDAETSDFDAKLLHQPSPGVSDADDAISRRSRSIASPATPPKPRIWDDDNAFHAFQVEHSKLGVDLTISCDELPTNTTDRNKSKSKECKKPKISMGHVEIVMSELDNAGFIAQQNLNRLQVRYSTDGHRDLEIEETDRAGSSSSQKVGRFDHAENHRSRPSTAPDDHSPVHETQGGHEGGRALESYESSRRMSRSPPISRSPPLRYPSHVSISSSSSRGESGSSSEAQQKRKEIVELSHQVAEQEDLSPYHPCANRLETPFPLHDREPSDHRRPPPNLAFVSTKTNHVSPGGFIRAPQESVREPSHVDHDASLSALDEPHGHRDASCVPQDETSNAHDTCPIAEDKSYVDQDPLYDRDNTAYECQDLAHDGQDTADDGPDTVYNGQDTADGGRDTAYGGQDTPYDGRDESNAEQQASYVQQDPDESHAFQEGYDADPEESHVAQDAPDVDNVASRALDNHQTRICQPQPESDVTSPVPPSSPASRMDEQADYTDDDEDRSDEEIMSRLDCVDSGHDLRRGCHDGYVEEHEEEERAPSAAPNLCIPKNSESNPISISSSPSPSVISHFHIMAGCVVTRSRVKIKVPIGLPHRMTTGPHNLVKPAPPGPKLATRAHASRTIQDLQVLHQNAKVLSHSVTYESAHAEISLLLSFIRVDVDHSVSLDDLTLFKAPGNLKHFTSTPRGVLHTPLPFPAALHPSPRRAPSSHSGPATCPIVEIVSSDPKLAAKAAAILKVHHGFIPRGCKVDNTTLIGDGDLEREMELSIQREETDRSLRLQNSSTHSSAPHNLLRTLQTKKILENDRADLPEFSSYRHSTATERQQTPQSNPDSPSGSRSPSTVPTRSRKDSSSSRRTHDSNKSLREDLRQLNYRPDFDSWSPSDWKILEFCFKRIERKQPTDNFSQAPVQPEQVVMKMLEALELGPSDCQSEWEWTKMIYRVIALQKRRSADPGRSRGSSTATLSSRRPIDRPNDKHHQSRPLSSSSREVVDRGPATPRSFVRDETDGRSVYPSLEPVRQLFSRNRSTTPARTGPQHQDHRTCDGDDQISPVQHSPDRQSTASSHRGRIPKAPPVSNRFRRQSLRDTAAYWTSRGPRRVGKGKIWGIVAAFEAHNDRLASALQPPPSLLLNPTDPKISSRPTKRSRDSPTHSSTHQNAGFHSSQSPTTLFHPSFVHDFYSEESNSWKKRKI